MEDSPVYVCGHRNPDCDSVMSACALAELRRHTGCPSAFAICPGNLPPRAKWVFNRFAVKPPPCRNDVYVRVADIVSRTCPSILSTVSLKEALLQLRDSGESTLPVVDPDNRFLGMLSPIGLLDCFIEGRGLSIPVGDATLRKCAGLSGRERVHDVRGACLRDSHNHFPVIDEEGRLIGTVLKRAFAEPPPQRMILVDHNETAQSIPGAEELPVVEVVDHHRIAFAATSEPIRYTADVVGSTCTIVTRMYRGAGLRPSKEIAGILLAGIVADTLLFQSPTTTETDRVLAAWLEKICGATAGELMDGMMSVASPLVSLSPSDAIDSDRKTYRECGYAFTLGQLEETNLEIFRRRIPALDEALGALLSSEGLDFACLMVTDPVRGNSELLFRGVEEVRRALPWRRTGANRFSLPGVLSRKKQLLPQILSSISGMRA